MRHPFLSLVVSLLALSACERSGADARPTFVRDSAGVRIVESVAPAWDSASAWRIAGSPRVRIGREEGPPEDQLHLVTAAVRLSDGRIAVANAGTSEVRVYAADGTHLASLGREGDGPGEFQGLDRLWGTPGDSLLAYDVLQRRFTRFDPQGRVDATQPLPLGDTGASSPELVGRFGDGTLLVKLVPRLTPSAPAGMSRVDATYVRAGVPERLDTLQRAFETEQWLVRQEEGVTGYDPPFGRTTRVAMGEDGFYLGTTERYEIRRYAADGRLEMVLRRRHANAPVTDADLAWYRERLMQGASVEGRARLERVLASMPRPRTRPAHGRMLLDRKENLWVMETASAPAEPPRWSVFSPEGTWLGTVFLPLRFRPLEIGTDYVLGVGSDPDTGVEEVHLYELRQPNGRR